MNRRVEPWDPSSGDLEQVAVLWGEDAEDVRTDLAGLPGAATPIALFEEPRGARRILAAALFLPYGLLGDRCALARLSTPSEREIDAALLLVEWAEARAAAEHARRLEIVERHAPGISGRLEELGYRATDELVRMRRTAPRAVAALPEGFDERSLADAGIDAWVEATNASFADVAFSAPATRAEYARQAAEPGFDAALVRIVVDGTGPVAFLRGTVSAAGVAEVLAIGVVPRVQRRGLGRWVLRRCEQLLDERAPREVILRVAASNHRAHDLYRREGYVDVARQRAWSRAL